MRSFLIAATLLLACVGADDGALGMAEEVNGECVFTPGSYVAEYEIVDLSGCEGMEPLPDEFMTVTESGRLAGATREASDGCVDGTPLVEGCFFSFDRACVSPSPSGRVELQVNWQIDYAEGIGHVTASTALYSGAILLDTCLVTQEATIRER